MCVCWGVVQEAEQGSGSDPGVVEHPRHEQGIPGPFKKGQEKVNAERVRSPMSSAA